MGCSENRMLGEGSMGARAADRPQAPGRSEVARSASTSRLLKVPHLAGAARPWPSKFKITPQQAVVRDKGITDAAKQ
jgi:hypothetical protein